ncbi:MAG TPA: DUF1150 family protein [Stellaceae bacterium]|nr:DUF1150 family protein [Stellaceae bacterium]
MSETAWLAEISPGEFARLGIEQIAYVKQVVVNDVVGYAVHAADGTQIALLPSRELASATLMQHDMEALSVH